MSDLLSLGASGVSAYRTALSTVSENIANAGTPGYSRRTVQLQEVSGRDSGITAIRAFNGSGVVAAGIARSADPLKNAAVRGAGADLAATEAGSTWLTRVQSALTGNAVGDRVTAFYNAATTLAADPSSATARSAMLEAGSSAAGAFAATGKAIDQAGADLDTTGDAATDQLSALAGALAQVNEGLMRTGAGTTAAANLADQRDSLLDRMSAISDVSVSLDGFGRANVRAGGAGGPMLVDGTDGGQVTYHRNGDGAVSFQVSLAGRASALAPAGGALAGIIDGAQRLKAARTDLDAAASAFTTSVNTVQTGGDDLNGRPGTAFFAVGATPTDISLALTDPRTVAAASRGGGPRDGSNLDALQSARTRSGVETALTSLTAGNAAALAQRTTVADAQSAIRDNAVAARDAGSAVDLDTEAVDLLRFQQAYSASSRVIQVARETFQSILEIR